ncbi:MAG: hypothetical protein Terrestrivirus4_166 [Terrestrivirus sp.]|uniref:C2H2-type domain-containing protein n=1 Tax=Terrestrivirus sp. TaxID=2487775 RepID=A0A3G4ZMQ5_9VIRU|nr:MAG: hypothetical protein Terrestrivirus4_166 [Terrestrivirus sp.]
MVEYKCERCLKIFSKKCDYTYHINRKTPCIIKVNTQSTTINQDSPQLTQINQINQFNQINQNLSNKFKCNYCNKEFCNKYTLERHLNERCKIKKEDTSKKEEIYQLLLRQMKEIKEDNKKMFDELKAENLKLKNELAIKNNTTINNTNTGTMNTIENQTNNNTNNQQNNIKNLNINLIAHGKEDLSFITDDQMKKILNKGFKSIENLTQIVYFDKNRPENHNIYISNIKDSYVMMYDGNDWKLMNRENCLQDIYDDKCDYLVEKFEQLEGKLDESTLKRFGNFLSRKDDDKIIEQTKREIKLILYNNRKIPEETRRLLRLNDENMIDQLC